MMESGVNNKENIFYTAVWCDSSEIEFRKSIPLELMGESIVRYNSTFKFNLVFLEGLDNLSVNYLKTLVDNGFNIIDYSKNFVFIKEEYSNILSHFSKYESYCFLRWIAFKNISKNDCHFIHLDSDVIMHISLDELYLFCVNKTFMLQGCPVLVSVSNREWFDFYQDELIRFNNDIIGYSQKAFLLMNEIKKNDRALCNISLYRNPLGSDQDLLEYLVSAKKVVQNDANIIFGDKYYLIQNPLSIKDWHEMQSESFFFYNCNNNQIFIGGKLVPFIHYQNTFARYANIFYCLNKFISSKYLMKKLLYYKIQDSSFKTNRIHSILDRFINKNYDRNAVIKRMNNSKNIVITKMLNFLQK